MLGIGTTTIKLGSGKVSGDPYTDLARSFFLRVQANGYTMATEEKNYYNDNFFVVAEGNGLSSHIDRLHIYSSYNAVIARTSLFGNYFAVPIGSPVFTAKSGYTMGAAKAINTNFNASIGGLKGTLNSNSFGTRQDGTVSNDFYLMGGGDGVSLNALTVNASNGMMDGYFNSNNHSTSAPIYTLGDNKYSGKRTSATSITYRSNSATSTTIAASTSIPNVVQYDGAFNNNGTIVDAHASTLRYGYHGDAALDITVLQTLLDSFILAM